MESMRREKEGSRRKAFSVRSLRQWVKNLPLRGYFLLVVFAVFGTVVVLSGLTIWCCSAFQHYLLPDPDAAYLTVQEIRADGSVSEMTTWLDFGEATRLPLLVEEAEAAAQDTDQAETAVQGETDQQGQMDQAEAAVQEKTDQAEAAVQGETDQAETASQEKTDRTETVVQKQTEADAGWHTMWETDRGEMVDATYSIQKIEKNFDTLTPKRKLAYRLCGAAMVVVPATLSIGGILFAGFFFYKKRLKEPLAILSGATGQIAAQNLDFSIEYPCGDELGKLCESFERMRAELAQNNKSMWRLLNQRRIMQASIAHDLRNPIAIIQGYAEYLQMHLQTGDLNPEKMVRIAANLKAAAKRLEEYTESVRVLNRLEDMEPDRKEIKAGDLMEEIRDDLKVMADRSGVDLSMEKLLTEGCLKLDKMMFFRILENVFENAARFAASQVSVEFARRDDGLTVTVADDGAGFPEEILRKREKALLPTGHGDSHLGMGLAISRVLCEKLGGSLELRNKKPHGAEVKIFLRV